MKSLRLPFFLPLPAIHTFVLLPCENYLFSYSEGFLPHLSRGRLVYVPLPFVCPHLGWMSSERTEREGNRNKITSFFGYGFFSPSFLPRRTAPLAYLLVFSISIPDSRFSKLVFNIQNEILIKSNLPIPSEYISRNDKI